MRWQRRTYHGLALGILLALFHFLLANDDALAVEKAERLNREFVLRSGGRLTVENSRGDIHVSSWKTDRVQLQVRKTGDSEEDMELVPLEFKARDDELNIKSLFPVYAPNLRVRVDYRLQVPAHIDLKLIKSINGDVSVSDVTGAAAIQVDNGEITIKDFAGVLNATTLNGKIAAQLTRLNQTDFVKLESFNGDILLRLPKGVKAHWVVQTLNGTIESDLPFAIQSNFGPRVVHFADGVEEPLVRAYSVNGNIQIRQR